MARPSSRESIMEAAEHVVLEVGASHLTLDAVAARANISKGGLLYHFPTKESLLSAMIESLLEDYRARREEVLATLPDEPGRELRAHLLLSIGGCDNARSGTKCKIASALLAAVANDPAMFAPIRENCQAKLLRCAGTGEDFDPRRAVAWLATEGFLLMQLLGVSPVGDRERELIANELLKMTGAVAAGPRQD